MTMYLLDPITNVNLDKIEITDKKMRRYFGLIDRYLEIRPYAGTNQSIEKALEKMAAKNIEWEKETKEKALRIINRVYKDSDGYTKKQVEILMMKAGIENQYGKGADKYENSIKRRGCSLYPRYTTINNNMKQACHHYLELKRFEGLIVSKKKVLFMGSCFARSMNKRYNMTKLAESEHVTIFEWKNTPQEIVKRLKQVNNRRIFKKEELDEALKERAWSTLDDINRISKKNFLPDIFVITYGKSQKLRDGGERMNALPIEEHNIESINQQMKEIINTCKRINIEAKIILMLSPVPLTSSIKGPGIANAIEADTISKSLGRVGIYNLMKEDIPNVYYWPCYEITRWMLCNENVMLYGQGTDMYHLSNKITEIHEELFLEATK